jgi:pimeloyl-ACP methyl ester carboxylesterase
MTTVEVDGTSLGYRHVPGARDLTFVFVNALTGSAAMWETSIAPCLRRRGYGTLAFDLPGQGESVVAAGEALTPARLTAATAGIVAALAPSRPAFVGLSIGGLFALQAHLAGTPAAGFVLINTLRRPGPRLAWINDAVVRLASLGGGRLVRDAYAPLLFGPDWLAAHRDEALTSTPYDGLAPAAAERRLLEAGGDADWDVDYERVRPPVVVLSGLADRVFFDAGEVAALSARFPDAVRQDDPAGGHLLPVERPKTVVRACLALAGRIGDG